MKQGFNACSHYLYYKHLVMKRIVLFYALVLSLFTTIPVAAQWSWQGSLYFGINQNLFLPVTIIGDVEITVADGYTLRAPQAVTGNGYTMTKKGGGRFWFQADNPLFDANIVYVGKSDTVQLDGIFGQFINDSIGYSYTGNLISSNDSVSLFYLHQNDTVVQTFNASGYNNTNTNLYILNDTKSTLRMIKSSDKLSGIVHISDSGTLYIDGTYKAKILVSDGKLITGENSIAGHRDYATFASWASGDTTIAIDNAVMQIGMYNGPSLLNNTSGNIYQNNNSVLEIDVYNPATSWNLTPGIHPDWTNSFSDRLYIAGNYTFDTGSEINVNWDSAYVASIAYLDTFYLPVIMTPAPGHITGANNVSIDQSLPEWELEFIVSAGQSGTTSGWGYIKGIKKPVVKRRTVQAYRSVEVGILIDTVFAGTPVYPLPFNPLDSVTMQPKAGVLSVTGASSIDRFVYTNTGASALINNVDSFSFRYTFLNPLTTTLQTYGATVYIYVLQDENGSSACQGSSYTVRLANKPVGVDFNWYHTLGGAQAGTGATRTLPAVNADSTYYIQPLLPGDPYGDFPAGQFTVWLSNKPGMSLMRWTGLFNSDWHNPNNWVTVYNGNEIPAMNEPSICTDVVLPASVPHYPALVDSGRCRHITVQDRAMLKNPHPLLYTSARVEFGFNSLERDRFVMWSAPLKDMYSGDYHFKNGSGQPQWGDLSMQFFQQANPDNSNSAAVANYFTATFGKVAQPLSLGQPFNLLVTSTSRIRDSLLIFPQLSNITNYTDANNVPFTLSRSAASMSRFITDGVLLNASGRFALPVYSGTGASYPYNNINCRIIQVVNPYLAYLRVDSFLLNNSNLANGYYIWDGNVNNGFVSVSVPSPGLRYILTNPDFALDLAGLSLIPPLQSFFVAKNVLSSDVTQVWMSPAWTTLPDMSVNNYQVRSSQYVISGGVLYLKASQDGTQSYAALSYDLDALAGMDKDDLPALFYDEIPLTVYSLTTLHEPLSVNASSDFQSQPVGLGLRISAPGEVKLSFSGLETFGHRVYLIDKERNETVDLCQTPEYTFTATLPPNFHSLELNDRFFLQMEYTGRGLIVGNEEASQSIQVSVQEDIIHVRSLSGRLNGLKVYNLNGQLVYRTGEASEHYQVRVSGQQVYILNIRNGEVNEMRKVIVK
jgi:hypothetical protein